jgi:hypothetical protein
MQNISEKSEQKLFLGKLYSSKGVAYIEDYRPYTSNECMALCKLIHLYPIFDCIFS